MEPKDRKISRYINDFAGVLDMEDEKIQNIEDVFDVHYDIWGEQIITIIIPSLENWSLKKIWMEYFNENWFGNKEQNNGLLLIIAEKEKKLRIMAWKWLKKKYPIKILRAIVENRLRTLLNIWDYTRLLEAWLEVTTKDEYVNELNTPKKTSSSLLWWYIWSIFMAIIMYFIVLPAATILCNMYYYNEWFFWYTSSLIILFLFMFLCYRKYARYRKILPKIMLWVFMLGLFGSLGHFIYLEIHPQKKLEQPLPEWCKVSSWGLGNIINNSDNSNSNRSSSRNSSSDNDSDKSWSDYDIDFWWWGSTDGYWYGD